MHTHLLVAVLKLDRGGHDRCFLCSCFLSSSHLIGVMISLVSNQRVII